MPMNRDETRILETESNSMCRKYKESARAAYLTNPINQPSLDISPIWIPFISNKINNSQSELCDVTDSL
jgi:hypothetical protein